MISNIASKYIMINFVVNSFKLYYSMTWKFCKFVILKAGDQVVPHFTLDKISRYPVIC